MNTEPWDYTAVPNLSLSRGLVPVVAEAFVHRLKFVETSRSSSSNIGCQDLSILLFR